MQKHKLSTDGWRLCENEEMKLKLLLGLFGRLIESKDSILKRNKSFLLGNNKLRKILSRFFGWLPKQENYVRMDYS